MEVRNSAIDYEGFYRLFKKIPIAAAFSVVVGVFIWSIIEVAVFGSEYVGFGRMRLEPPFAVILVRLISSIIPAVTTYFLAAIVIATVVVQTDTLLEINIKLAGKDSSGSKKEAVSAESGEQKKAISTPKKKNSIEIVNDVEYIDTVCPRCAERLSFEKDEVKEGENLYCPYCDFEFVLSAID